MRTVIDRQEIIEKLTERDGYACMFPDCTEPLTDEGKHMVTLDHIYPQVLAKADGWTHEQINDLSNLQLMGKNCNARKGHLVPDENGILPVKPYEPKIAKQERPLLCDTCFAGRILLPGETCPDCESGPQPSKWPTSLQKRPKECDHSTHHCWICVVDDPTLRIPATQRLITGP